MKDVRKTLIAALKDGIFALKDNQVRGGTKQRKYTQRTIQVTCNKCQTKGRGHKHSLGTANVSVLVLAAGEDTAAHALPLVRKTATQVNTGSLSVNRQGNEYSADGLPWKRTMTAGLAK